MHSAIELAKRNVAVYTMIDWLNIFRSARRRNPYTVAYNSCHVQTSMIWNNYPKITSGKDSNINNICIVLWTCDTNIINLLLYLP